MLTVFEQSVNRELPSLILQIVSNIILSLRKKCKFNPRLLPCNTCAVFYPSVEVREICVQNLKIQTTSGHQLHVQRFRKFHGNQKSPTRLNGGTFGNRRWLELKTLSAISVWGKLFYDPSEDLDPCVRSSTKWTCLGRSTHTFKPMWHVVSHVMKKI